MEQKNGEKNKNSNSFIFSPIWKHGQPRSRSRALTLSRTRTLALSLILSTLSLSVLVQLCFSSPSLVLPCADNAGEQPPPPPPPSFVLLTSPPLYSPPAPVPSSTVDGTYSTFTYPERGACKFPRVHNLPLLHHSTATNNSHLFPTSAA